ncbi:MAG: FecR domain-containing protein [Opitutaceae bacterium]|nr:FecR domain-containing protein [Opitutaceae bacterium]
MKPDANKTQSRRTHGRDRALDEQAAAWIARQDAGLSASEEREFASWRSADPAHEAALAQLSASWGALDRPVRAGAGRELIQELAHLDRRQRRRRVGASLLTVILLVSLSSAWPWFGRPSSPAATLAIGRVVAPDRMTLDDGTVVDLREGAEVEPQFSAATRRIVLRRGEAHFQVKRDPLRPFVVSADNLDVRAVGTAFAVSLSAGNVEVIVTEGRVSLASTSTATPILNTTTDSVLGAGQRAVLGKDEVAAVVSSVQPAEIRDRLGWRTPRLEFTAVPLGAALDRLNAYADIRGGVRFLLEDPVLAQTPISGLFRVDNTAALIDLLENGFGVEAEQRSTTEVVFRRRP